jgi:hypothetical protein
MRSVVPYGWPIGPKTESERNRWQSFRSVQGPTKIPSRPRSAIAIAATNRVTLSWDRPKKFAQFIAKYRIYKGTESNLVLEVVDPNRFTADIPVTEATPSTYFITAVNALGKESSPVTVRGARL